MRHHKGSILKDEVEEDEVEEEEEEEEEEDTSECKVLDELSGWIL